MKEFAVKMQTEESDINSAWGHLTLRASMRAQHPETRDAGVLGWYVEERVRG